MEAPILPEKNMVAFPFSVESLCCRFSDAYLPRLCLVSLVRLVEFHETLDSCYSWVEKYPFFDRQAACLIVCCPPPD